MTDHPLRPEAAEVLGTVPAWTPAELLAALADQATGVTAELTGCFSSWPDDAAPVETTALLAAADREADRLGNYYIRCEHLLLGMQRLLGGDDDVLRSARAEYQRLRGDLAFGEYLRLRPLPRPDGAPRPCAVIVNGVPGTGKSTLAEALARELRAPVFSADWELGALVPLGAVRDDNAEPVSELKLAASMARQLQLGVDVIVDCLLLSAGKRRRMRDLAEALDAAYLGVECDCSDERAHRSRVEGRSRGIPGWPATVTWEHVQRMRARWEPWPEPHLVLDSAVETPGTMLGRVLDAVDAVRTKPPAGPCSGSPR
jgi:predicted kinase